MVLEPECAARLGSVNSDTPDKDRKLSVLSDKDIDQLAAGDLFLR